MFLNDHILAIHCLKIFQYVMAMMDEKCVVYEYLMYMENDVADFL